METFITTASGAHFNFMDPDPETIHLNDIAHALSHCCRFAGHTSAFYSVAQHSVLVSNEVAKDFRLDALMHDAAEAYLGDMTSPLKRMLPQYKAIEHNVEQAIRYRFGLRLDLPPDIKRADLRLLATERREFMTDQLASWEILEGVTPLPSRITALEPAAAKQVFLRRFNVLYEEGHRYG